MSFGLMAKMTGKNRHKRLLQPLGGANCLDGPVENQKQVIFTHEKCLQSNKYGRKQLL